MIYPSVAYHSSGAMPTLLLAALPGRAGIYSHFWLLLHEYTLLYTYTYTYIDIQRIQYTDSMVPSFARMQQSFSDLGLAWVDFLARPAYGCVSI